MQLLNTPSSYYNSLFRYSIMPRNHCDNRVHGDLMILQQIKRIGEIQLEREGKSAYEVEIGLSSKYSNTHVIAMDVHVHKLLETALLNEIVEFHLEEFKDDASEFYMIDTPSGAGDNDPPIIVWYESRAKDSDEAINNKRIEKVSKSVNKSLKTWDGIDDEHFKQEFSWYKRFLDWISEHAGAISSELSEFITTHCAGMTKSTRSGLVIVPRFWLPGGAGSSWPGQLDVVKKIYMKNKTPKKSIEATCLACGEVNSIPTKATLSNVTGWFTLDQLAFQLPFHNHVNSAAPICMDCLRYIRKGLSICEEIGSKFSLGFAYKEGDSYSVINQLVIPMAQGKDELSAILNKLLGLRPRELLDRVLQVESDLILADGEADDQDGTRKIDISFFLDSKEILKCSYMFIHYIKEKQGGKHRLLHSSHATRSNLERLSKMKRDIQDAFGINHLDFKPMYYLMGGAGSNEDTDDSSAASRYFTCLNALLAMHRIGEHFFVKRSYSTIKSAMLKKLQQEGARKNPSSKILNLKIRSFKAYHALYENLQLFK